ncbi:MAG: alpha/beta hydrolase [Myxococcota bacterium]
MRKTLALLLLAAVGCEIENTLLFDRSQTDRYTFPDNRVPEHLLREATLTTDDGAQIALAWAQQAEPTTTILLLHGRGGNIDEIWDRVMTLWDRGFAVVVIDYRGFGRSSGEPSEAGLYEDGRTTVAWLEQEGVQRETLVVWGISLGTAVASQLGVELPVYAVVLDAPFTRMRDMVEEATPIGLPGDWVIESEWDTLGRIDGLLSPLVVAHGTDDNIVPLRLGRIVFEAAPEPKAFVPVEDAGHNNLILDHADPILAALEAVTQP